MAYESEAAFRSALTARISRAARTSRWTRDEIATAFALQVFLGRLFREPDTADQWLLTGGTALQYRAPDYARPTADADLAAQLEFDELSAALHRAAAAQPNEYGRFTLTLTRTDTAGMHKGSLTYILSDKRVATAKLDIATQRHYLYAPEHVTPGPIVELDGLAAMPSIPLNSAADALADKVAAMYEMHGRDATSPSTRPHDLVDVVILAHTERLSSDEVRTAIEGQEQRRAITIPRPLTLPNPVWRTTYPDRAEHTGLPAEYFNVEAALRLAGRVVDPILAGEIAGQTWNPAELRWGASIDNRNRPAINQLLALSRPPRHRRRDPAQGVAPDNPRTPPHHAPEVGNSERGRDL